MIKHLCTYNHNIKFIRFQPLEKIKKHQEQSHTKFEDFGIISQLSWIKRPYIAYPLGQNGKILGQGHISKTSSTDIRNIVDKRHNQLNINYKLDDLLSIFKNNSRQQWLC